MDTARGKRKNNKLAEKPKLPTGLYWRKDSRYIWMTITNEDGKRVQFSTKCSNKKDALKVYESSQKAILEEKFGLRKTDRSEVVYFKELTAKYKEYAEGRYEDYDRLRKYIYTQLEAAFGEKKLKDIKLSDLEMFQSSCRKRGLKNSTIEKKINVFMHMLRKAVDWEFLDNNTLIKLRKLDRYEDDSARLRFISVAEAEKLIQNCDLHLQPIVITALCTGMRKREILNLCWSPHMITMKYGKTKRLPYVDLEQGFIFVETQSSKNKRMRQIPISEKLWRILSNMVQVEGIPYLFFNRLTGAPYKNVPRSFTAAVARTKLVDFRFHDLRHTFASQLVIHGVDLNRVRELLGHADMKMTMRYAHLAPNNLRGPVDWLGSQFKNLNRHELPHRAERPEVPAYALIQVDPSLETRKSEATMRRSFDIPYLDYEVPGDTEVDQTKE